MSWNNFTRYDNTDLETESENNNGSWECFQVLEQHTSDVTCVQFLQSHLLASTSSDKTVCLWKAGSSTKFERVEQTPFLDHKYPVHLCSFSSHVALLASCSTDGTIILWNYETLLKVAILEHASRCPIRFCSFSPTNNTLVSGGDDGSLYLWDLDQIKIFKILDGHDNCITSCSFSADGEYIASTSSSSDIKIWDGTHSHTKSLLCIIDAHDLGVTTSSFQPKLNISDGSYRLTTGGNDGFIKGWKILFASESPDYICQWQIESHSSSIMWLEYSSSGKFLASCGGDKVVTVYNPVTRLVVAKLMGHSRFVTCCTFSADESILASCSNDKTIFLWEVPKEDHVHNRISVKPKRSLVTICNRVPLPLPPNVLEWSIDHVVHWLEKHGYNYATKKVRHHQIDGSKLLILSEKELSNVFSGSILAKKSVTKQIIEAIRKLQSQHRALQKVPDEMICPITYCIMKDPVVAADGYSYDHYAIDEWFSRGNTTSPMTNAPLETIRTIKNHNLRCLIKTFLEENNCDLSGL